MKKILNKVANFFKSIWANKGSIGAIITSTAAICIAVFIVLKGFVLGVGCLDFLKDITPGEDAIEAIEAINVGDILEPEVQAVAGVNVGDILVPGVDAVEAINVGDVLVPEVLAGEADVRAAINVGDILVPAVMEEDGITVKTPAVLATEADVREAINLGDVLVPAVLATDADVREAVEAVPAVIATEADVVAAVEYKAAVIATEADVREAVEGKEAVPAVVNGLNIFGEIALGVIAAFFTIFEICAICNKYGFESVEEFAARMAAKKAEVEAKLLTAEEKAECKEKLATFKKGLKDLSAKISGIEDSMKQLKILIDSGLATVDQVVKYNELVSESSTLAGLSNNYVAKIAELKDKLAK